MGALNWPRSSSRLTRNSSALGSAPTCDTLFEFCEKKAASSIAVTWSCRRAQLVESSFHRGDGGGDTVERSWAARGAAAISSTTAANPLRASTRGPDENGLFLDLELQSFGGDLERGALRDAGQQ